ncbi:MAG: thioredoxin family protein [Thermoplasmata archaeon]|nr:thioredoxin family protein [Thermoplasmata archaeon]
MERFEAAAFRKTELLREGTWIVAFVADWCPFCHRFLPQFSVIESEKGFRIATGDVTSEESPLWDDFRIDVVPTLVVFRNGTPIFRVDGVLGRGLPVGGLEQARAAALSRTG